MIQMKTPIADILMCYRSRDKRKYCRETTCYYHSPTTIFLTSE